MRSMPSAHQGAGRRAASAAPRKFSPGELIRGPDGRVIAVAIPRHELCLPPMTTRVEYHETESCPMPPIPPQPPNPPLATEVDPLGHPQDLTLDLAASASRFKDLADEVYAIDNPSPPRRSLR